VAPGRLLRMATTSTVPATPSSTYPTPMRSARPPISNSGMIDAEFPIVS